MVKDHGLEALRKSAREVVDGNKSEYELRIYNDELKQILEAIRDNGAGSGVDSGSILSGIKYDQVQATYPTTSQEVYTYSLSASVVATITVNYSDATKKNILSLVRT
jgi:hypothetical protein